MSTSRLSASKKRPADEITVLEGAPDERILLKILNDAESHHGFRYKTGLNVLNRAFVPSLQEGEKNGLYCSWNGALEEKWLLLGTHLREVQLPSSAQVTFGSHKIKCDRMILGEKKWPLDERATIEKFKLNPMLVTFKFPALLIQYTTEELATWHWRLATDRFLADRSQQELTHIVGPSGGPSADLAPVLVQILAHCQNKVHESHIRFLIAAFPAQDWGRFFTFCCGNLYQRGVFEDLMLSPQHATCMMKVLAAELPCKLGALEKNLFKSFTNEQRLGVIENFIQISEKDEEDSEEAAAHDSEEEEEKEPAKRLKGATVSDYIALELTDPVLIQKMFDEHWDDWIWQTTFSRGAADLRARQIFQLLEQLVKVSMGEFRLGLYSRMFQFFVALRNHGAGAAAAAEANRMVQGHWLNLYFNHLEHRTWILEPQQVEVMHPHKKLCLIHAELTPASKTNLLEFLNNQDDLKLDESQVAPMFLHGDVFNLDTFAAFYPVPRSCYHLGWRQPEGGLLSMQFGILGQPETTAVIELDVRPPPLPAGISRPLISGHIQISHELYSEVCISTAS